MDKIFVETTAQVSRLTGPHAVQANLERNLAGWTVLTSSIVFLEFQRVVIDAHRRVLPCLEEIADEGNGLTRLADLYLRLASSPAIASGRQAKRVIAVIGSIQANFADEEYVSVGDLRAFIAGEIRRFREWRFFTFWDQSKYIDIRDSGGYLDSLECDVARHDVDPKKKGARMVSCNARTRQCAIRSAISKHKDLLRLLSGHLKDEDRKASRAADRLADMTGRRINGRKAIGQQLCWPLGDVFIALDCPEDAALLSSDKHFDLICPAVGRSRLYLNYRTGDVAPTK